MREYRPDIDGLRAISIALVVIFHAFPYAITGGFVGVDVFFVISGYLITLVVYEGLHSNTFSFSNFYTRRVRRIFPALLIVLASVYFSGWFILVADEYKQLGKHIASGAIFVANYAYWGEAGYFDRAAITKPLLHLWSLSVEEQFYLLWPFYVWTVWRLRINAFAATIAVFLISLAISFIYIRTDRVAAFFALESRVWEIMAGSLLAFSCKNRSSTNIGYASKMFLNNLISIAGFIILAISSVVIDKTTRFPAGGAVMPVLAATLIIGAGPHAYINNRILSSKILVWFGLISFSLYLWHWPIFVILKAISIEELTVFVKLSAIGVSILLAWGTYQYIENPVRIWGVERIKTSLIFFALMVMGLVGYFTYVYDGVHDRGIQVRYNRLYTPEARLAEQELVKEFSNYYGNKLSIKPLIVVIGDSYATNWGVAISKTVDLKSFDLAVVSYQGCEVQIKSDQVFARPLESVYKKRCNTFEELVNDASIHNRIKSILMVSHRPFEYETNPKRFQIVEWLSDRRRDVDFFVFGNYFQLDENINPSCVRLMVKADRTPEICIEEANYLANGVGVESFKFYPENLKLNYVDVKGYICNEGVDNKCPFEYGGVPFMQDWNHMTATFLTGYLPVIFQKHNELKKYVKSYR